MTLLVALVGVLGGTADPSFGELSAVRARAAQSPFLTPASHDASSLDAVREIVPALKKRLFEGLFRVPETTMAQTKRNSSRITPPSPRVVCGLTMYEVNSDIDAKIIVAAPNRSVDFKVRRIVPSTCRE